jgi:hypothetical protein
MVEDEGPNQSKHSKATAKIDQAYLALEYESGNDIYLKKDGKWCGAVRMCKKDSGVWTEISKSEAKIILENNIIRRG